MKCWWGDKLSKMKERLKANLSHQHIADPNKGNKSSQHNQMLNVV